MRRVCSLIFALITSLKCFQWLGKLRLGLFNTKFLAKSENRLLWRAPSTGEGLKAHVHQVPLVTLGTQLCLLAQGRPLVPCGCREAVILLPGICSPGVREKGPEPADNRAWGKNANSKEDYCEEVVKGNEVMKTKKSGFLVKCPGWWAGLKVLSPMAEWLCHHVTWFPHDISYIFPGAGVVSSQGNRWRKEPSAEWFSWSA